MRRKLPAKGTAAVLAGGTLGGQALSCARIGAQRIIEIKEHGGAFCGRGQQIFELAESVRLDDVALVRGEEPAIFALTGKDVEMVEPEIVHDLLKLGLAIGRASHFCHGELFDNPLWTPGVVRDGAGNGVGIRASESVAIAGAPSSTVTCFRRLLHGRVRTGILGGLLSLGGLL